MKTNQPKVRGFFCTIVSLFVLLPNIAWAWGDLGHETVGEIAEQLINQDARTKRAVQAILGVEPYAVAAIWPDHARSDERFQPADGNDGFAYYHYVTIYRDPNKYTAKDARTVLEKYPRVLADPRAPREAKMIALRYLIHVVGDVQQPLHVGNEFDRGGNSCKVNWRPNADRTALNTNLHSVWDTELVDYMANSIKLQRPDVKYFGYKQVAQSLMAKYQQLINLHRRDIQITNWITESKKLREEQAYPDRLPEDGRVYCGARTLAHDEALANPTLNKEFADQRMPIVEQRLVLGGVRLAALLTQIFNSTNVKKPVENEILQMLKLTNDVE